MGNTEAWVTTRHPAGEVYLRLPSCTYRPLIGRRVRTDGGRSVRLEAPWVRLRWPSRVFSPEAASQVVRATTAETPLRIGPNWQQYPTREGHHVSMSSWPPRVGIVSSQEMLAKGLIAMLEEFPGRFELVEPSQADIVLYDVFGIHSCDGEDLARVLRESRAVVVAVSRDLRPDLRARALAAGAHTWISMSASSQDLIDAVEAADAGLDLTDPSDSLGHDVGLTAREVEVVALITQGMSNQEIAQRLFLSINSVKSYIRSAYSKIGATTRPRVVAWALLNGFAPPDE